MRIGIDFDNTLVSYDALFHTVAQEWGLISAASPASKLAVRDTLRSAGLEERWTEMQGHVYGARMNEAAAYPGAIEFILSMAGSGHAVSIVSHKTRYPFLGPKYDLHVAARSWIDHHLQPQLDAAGLSIGVYFELTKGDKLERIAQLGCDAFIDDLPEILLAPTFPAATQSLLFDPDGMHAVAPPQLTQFNTWADLSEFFRAK